MKHEPEQIARGLEGRVKGNVFCDILHRAAFSTDASIYRIVPVCVAAPRDVEDVAEIVKYARDRGIAVAARGAGTGLAGESLTDGIMLDMTQHMNAIVRTSADGELVTCRPGAVLGDVNGHLRTLGRKIGPDPSSANRATAGGCVANNATGAHSLEYGHMGGHVVRLQAVLDDGSVVDLANDMEPGQAGNTRLKSIGEQCADLLERNACVIAQSMPRTKRNRSGYSVGGIYHDGRLDLARLMAGSEGTLAVFTEITLRTVALPRAKGLLQLEFDSLGKMAEAVVPIVESGATACEMMGQRLIGMAREGLAHYRDILPADTAATLLVEHTGDDPQEVRDKLSATDSAVGEIASDRQFFLGEQEQARLWKCRKDAGPLLYRHRSKKHPAEFMEDVSVEHTRLGEYIAGLEELGRKYDFTMSYFGHAGDGELHLRPYLDLGSTEDVQKMRAIAEDVFNLAWSLGGSISGEHADGLVRAAFIRGQYGPEFYKVLCKIKEIFDPEAMLNPGKIINADPDVMVKNLRRAKHVLAERAKSELIFNRDELELELEQCYGCGLCLSKDPETRMCPVFRAMGEELASSRAKANLLNFWATGQLDEKDFESAEFRKFLDLCVNCKACQQDCPSGVDISTLMAAARAEYARRKGLRKTERLLSGNRFLSMAGSAFAPISNSFMGLPVFAWFMEKAIGVDRRRGMPGFLRGSFIKAGRKYMAAREPIEAPVDKVAYFVDTYANTNDHELGFAVLDVLYHNGIEVMIPDQLPAPLPAIVYGDVKRAKKDLQYSAKHLAEAVVAGYKIVCSEPSAALCLKDELRHYVTGVEAQMVSEHTYELMDYLRGMYEHGKLKKPVLAGAEEYAEGFVYHLPCHLAAIGGQGASMKLIADLCGIEVDDLRAGCCGLSGTFGMQKKNYDLSEQIGEGLSRALADSSTRNVLTECAACAMQIEHISDSVVRHPIKVLAACYRGEPAGKDSNND